MTGALRIVGLGGSLEQPSASLSALKLALAAAAAKGAQTELLDLRTLELPLYRRSLEPPADATRLAQTMSEADGFLWSTPLYHGTVSGAFKNALDWLELLA